MSSLVAVALPAIFPVVAPHEPPRALCRCFLQGSQDAIASKVPMRRDVYMGFRVRGDVLDPKP